MSQLQYENLSQHERKLLLLKVLGVNPDSIEKLRTGELMLSEAMSDRINEVINNPDDTTQCAIVCQNIKRDGASYETLDATPFLEHINELKARGGSFADDISAPAPGPVRYTVNSIGPQGASANGQKDFSAESPYDAAEQISRTTGIPLSRAIMYGPPESTNPHPFIRYFARLLDMSVYLLFVNLIFRFFLETDPLINTKVNVFWAYIVYAVMFLIEPLFIHFWGTTPGKFIFGIHITDMAGNKLSLKTAYRRSFSILRYGYGFVIPFYNLFRLFRSFSTCKNRQMLTWDIGMKITRPENTGAGRIVAFLLVFFALTSVDTVGNFILESPRNRGEITEEEFFENCSHIVKYDSIIFDDVPVYDIETVNGKISRVTFTVEVTDEDYIFEYYNQMYVAFMAFAGAQGNPLALGLNRSIMLPFKNCFADFSFNYEGLTVTNDVDYSGYARNIISNYLYTTSESEAHTYKQTFSIYK